jgi:hypothetical protein
VVIVPIIAIVIINIILFTISRRSSKRIMASAQSHSCIESSNKRALTTVCALSCVFTLSWTPYFIFMIWKGVNSDLPPAVEQVGQCCIMINAFCNPIIYTMTNRRFGSFVWRMITKRTPGFCTGSVSSVQTSRSCVADFDSSKSRIASNSTVIQQF